MQLLIWNAQHIHMYYPILLGINNFLFCDSSIICLLYAFIVVVSCFLSSDKKEWNTSCHETISNVNDEIDWFEAPKLSNAIPLMDIDQLPP